MAKTVKQDRDPIPLPHAKLEKWHLLYTETLNTHKVYIVCVCEINSKIGGGGGGVYKALRHHYCKT